MLSDIRQLNYMEVKIHMLTVKSNPLEVRGIANKTTAQGKLYYVLNTETEDGSPEALYCPDASVFPEGLRKGDVVTVDFSVSRYGRNERLVVTSVHKV